jgi:ribosomal protein S2
MLTNWSTIQKRISRLKELEEQKFKLTKKEFEKAEILSKSVVNKINNLITEYMKTEYRSSDKILKIIEQMFKISQ